MSRYIDAEIAYDKIAEQETSYYMDMDGVQAGLDETPTVDAVPVKFIYENADLLRKCADEHGARVLYMLIENWNRADGERKEKR